MSLCWETTVALLDQAPKPAVKKAKRKELEKNKKKFFPSTREKKVEGKKKSLLSHL